MALGAEVTGSFEAFSTQLREQIEQFEARGGLTSWERRGESVIASMVMPGSRHEMLVRFDGESGAIVGIDDSDALEFAAVDSNDVADLAAFIDAFGRGELEVLIGERSGKYYGYRGVGFQLRTPEGPLTRLASGRRRWAKLS